MRERGTRAGGSARKQEYLTDVKQINISNLVCGCQYLQRDPQVGGDRSQRVALLNNISVVWRLRGGLVRLQNGHKNQDQETRRQEAG